MKLPRSFIAIGIVTLMSANAALAEQNHMESAIARLREARKELNRADHNKGGHRERTLSHVDAAIRECQAGVAWARNHR